MEEIEYRRPSKVVPTDTSLSIESFRSLSLDSRDESSLSYDSQQLEYKTRDKKAFKTNGNHHHYHSNEECFRRQTKEDMREAKPVVKKKEYHVGQNMDQGATGGTFNQIVASPGSPSSATGGQLRSLSSGYSSGLNRDKVWVEMYDGYGNEMRRKCYSDTLLIRVKHDLMEIADKWMVTTKRENYKIVDIERKYDLCALAPVFLEQPVGRSSYFMIQYS